MNRRPPILASLSLLLALAITALWVRSYAVEDRLTLNLATRPHPGWQTQWALASRTGCLDLIRYDYPDAESPLRGDPGPPRLGLGLYHTPRYDESIIYFWYRDERTWRRLGFTYYRIVHAPMMDMGVVYAPQGNGSAITIPIALPLLLASILPLLHVFAYLRSRRHRRNTRCPACGYDLRGHAPLSPSTRCPECGTPTHPATTSAPTHNPSH